MALSNNYNGGFSSFRMEDGKVLGRIRPGVKSASPGDGGQDYRFFVEPLSVLPPGYEEAENVGFTGFMSRIGYDCNEFTSEEDAWEHLRQGWGNHLILFTPALRNNRYFVLDDPQKENKPSEITDGFGFIPVPMFRIDDNPTFDGDINKFCAHLTGEKPLSGFSKKYWDKRILPAAVIAVFRRKARPAERDWYTVFAPVQAETFKKMEIGEGGAYFSCTDKDRIGVRFVDMTSSDAKDRIVLCHTAPLCFIPEDLLPRLKEGARPVPPDSDIFGMAGISPADGPAENLPEPVQKSAPAEPISRPADAGKPAGEERAVKKKTSAPTRRKASAASKEKDFIENFGHTALQKGLLYNEKDLINFHVSMKSSRLVILAGMSGTGKSRLVRLYGEALGLPPEQVRIIPVRPSWMDDSDILGCLDMRNMVYRPADTGLADLLREAAADPDKLYIICFDEMNLARAEHYFAQFISVLENDAGDQTIRLYNPAMEQRVYNHSEYPAEIPVKGNVLFAGTINVDESTYHFSDKILDRANVITLHQGKFRDLKRLYAEKPGSGKNEEISAVQYDSFRDHHAGIAMSDKELEFLDELNGAIKESGLAAGIGFRVAAQMDRYLSGIPTGLPFTRADGIDCQTVQRILTKLRGSTEQLAGIISVEENGALAGTAAGILDRYSGLSSFDWARTVLLKKARELKAYDYTI